MKEQSLVVGKANRSSVHPNIATINQIWLLVDQLPDSRQRAKERDEAVQGIKDGNTAQKLQRGSK